METNKLCDNNGCPRKDLDVSLTFLCEFCKMHRYCSQNCRLEDWNSGHKDICENNFHNHIIEIEQSCPFLTSGLILSKTETKKKVRKIETVLDNYEKANVEGTATSVLGKGAYGKVFLMRNKRTRQLVAMKIMEKKFLGNPNMLKALTREIEIHKTLLHDNIIRLIEHCEDTKNIYLLMEYASKGNLFHYIRASKKLSEKEVFYFFTQACNAIYFLHKHKLMHRDIKPENMLISSTGQLKLCDFGCCAPCDSDGRRSFCGTIEYMAPEVLKQNEYREKADVWSLGVLLYEMLHGYAPFQGKKEQETIKKIMEEKLVFSSEVQADARRLIKALLKESPTQRPCIQEIFDLDWIRRMQNEFKMNDRKERTVSNIFDDLNRSDSTERIEVVTSPSKTAPKKPMSPGVKKELKLAAKGFKQAKEVNKVSSQPLIQEEKKITVPIKRNFKSPIRRPQPQVQTIENDFNDEELSYEEVFGVARRHNRTIRSQLNKTDNESIPQSETIIQPKDDIKTITNDIEETTQEELIVEEQCLDETLGKELSVIDEGQEVSHHVENEEADTNTSFSFDDYASKRCDTLMKAINYLDGLDCGLELEDLDKYVKEIEHDNVRLKKLYQNDIQTKPIFIKPIATPIEDYNLYEYDPTEYKNSIDNIIASLMTIKSCKQGKTKVKYKNNKKEVVKDSSVPMWNMIFSVDDIKGV